MHPCYCEATTCRSNTSLRVKFSQQLPTAPKPLKALAKGSSETTEISSGTTEISSGGYGGCRRLVRRYSTAVTDRLSRAYASILILRAPTAYTIILVCNPGVFYINYQSNTFGFFRVDLVRWRRLAPVSVCVVRTLTVSPGALRPEGYGFSLSRNTD